MLKDQISLAFLSRSGGRTTSPQRTNLDYDVVTQRHHFEQFLTDCTICSDQTVGERTETGVVQRLCSC